MDDNTIQQLKCVIGYSNVIFLKNWLRKMTVDISKDAIKLVLQKILESSGPGSTGLEYIQGWILKFGENSNIILLVLKISLTDYPIRARTGRPIVHLCLVA